MRASVPVAQAQMRRRASSCLDSPETGREQLFGYPRDWRTLLFETCSNRKTALSYELLYCWQHWFCFLSACDPSTPVVRTCPSTGGGGGGGPVYTHTHYGGAQANQHHVIQVWTSLSLPLHSRNVDDSLDDTRKLLLGARGWRHEGEGLGRGWRRICESHQLMNKLMKTGTISEFSQSLSGFQMRSLRSLSENTSRWRHHQVGCRLRFKWVRLGICHQ